MNRLDRALGILLLLRGGKSFSASDLSGRFEVSTRTIYRDIETLCAIGVPIYAEMGRSGIAIAGIWPAGRRSTATRRGSGARIVCWRSRRGRPRRMLGHHSTCARCWATAGCALRWSAELTEMLAAYAEP